ncbi:RagB/SusD family nutrient uptake outer membrane protein [Terrimonas sp. NA20]|uniref:RagB/SusD family nutrient uptake outer membrane protein n=1 Tax=Terrimonas ginsenosidimutans TaxID=2908004 RepID=A0ABS9KQ65_9BACT|nr:RagB/SusD family nutrient uptake outer membrane protein [Terrimonas ginsenosidimutans]MCG2614462.1 RagB/SusD family nutrient uptake outer membrane protein [Terrimonas ginsenosidimutans]
MKKVFKHIFAATVLAATLATGCSKSDLVDLKPEFSLEALENPSSIDQVEEVLTAAYSRFRSGSYYGDGNGSGFSLMPDMMSDNLLETNESLANYKSLTDWIYAEDDALVRGIWAAPYAVITNANIVLRDIDKFTTTDNQRRANRIKGQALAIRAHAHFDLFRFFATSYDRNSTTILAVPYMTEFLVSPSVKPARLNNKDFYDRVIADLTAAVGLLGNVDATINPSTIKRPNIDLAGAKAIQARVYLYAGMYTEAITAASDVITARPLAPAASFAGMYNEQNAGEIIWNAQFDAGQGGPGGGVYFSQNNRSAYAPAAEIATMDGTTGLIRNDDVRYTAYFATIAVANGPRLVMRKYRGKAGLTDGNANFPVFRTGEMYLIRAEARARTSPAQETAAMNDLNVLRAARITNYTNENLTGAALLTAIANERRRELFGEGHRFFDLKRTTRTIVRAGGCGNPSISPAVCTLASNAREWALPIPFDERSVNDNIQQNPGY